MMNNGEATLYPLIPITELIRFMEAVHADNLACRVCAHKDWAYNVPDGAAGWGLPILSEDGGTSAKYFPVIALVCMNCGFIRYHSYKLVREWLDIHPREDGSSMDDHHNHPNVVRDHSIVPSMPNAAEPGKSQLLAMRTPKTGGTDDELP